MQTVRRNRRAALEGLTRILDAGAPEELFAGGQEEAAFLYALLEDTARARGSSYYWEICRTARGRRVTPEYVIDRATVLLAAMRERRRSDLYRILGVPPLASAETMRQRWLEVAKRHHPDVGGEGTVFRHMKQAYDVLRDPARRADYERFWVRALAPFERVAASGGWVLPEPLAPRAVAPLSERPVTVEEVAVATVTADRDDAPPDAMRAGLHAAARLFAIRNAFDRRVDSDAGGLTDVLARLEAVLAPVAVPELEQLRADAERVIVELETLRAQLDTLAALKRSLGV